MKTCEIVPPPPPGNFGIIDRDFPVKRPGEAGTGVGWESSVGRNQLISSRAISLRTVARTIRASDNAIARCEHPPRGISGDYPTCNPVKNTRHDDRVTGAQTSVSLRSNVTGGRGGGTVLAVLFLNESLFLLRPPREKTPTRPAKDAGEEARLQKASRCIVSDKTRGGSPSLSQRTSDISHDKRSLRNTRLRC